MIFLTHPLKLNDLFFWRVCDFFLHRDCVIFMERLQDFFVESLHDFFVERLQDFFSGQVALFLLVCAEVAQFLCVERLSDFSHSLTEVA